MSINTSHGSELNELASLLIGKRITRTLTQGGHQELLNKLNYHGITLLAAEQNTLPNVLTAKVTQHKAMMVANDHLKQIELASLFNAFEGAGLRSVLFKGSALAYSLYPKYWLRPRSDSDILIAPDDRHKFDRFLIELGYQRLFSIQGKYVSYQNTYSKALFGGSAINIDLHWHINNRQMFSNTFTLDELISNGQQLPNFGNAQLTTYATIPSTVDSLLIASIHRSGHHNSEERLAWLYDIHLLITSFNDDQWQQVWQQAQKKQVCAITLEALQLCQRLFKSTVNEVALKQLQIGANNNEPSSIFLNRTLSERHYFWADLKSMPSLAAKAGFLRENIIPDPAYVRRKMNTKSTILAYLKRLYRGIKRVF